MVPCEFFAWVGFSEFGVFWFPGLISAWLVGFVDFGVWVFVGLIGFCEFGSEPLCLELCKAKFA